MQPLFDFPMKLLHRSQCESGLARFKNRNAFITLLCRGNEAELGEHTVGRENLISLQGSTMAAQGTISLMLIGINH